jgi:hypothetical protein
MSSFSIAKLDRSNNKDLERWENIYNKADGATIFHNPHFLAYHKDRFAEHHLGIYKGETLLGILPLAISDNNGERIAKSPYGASYGGFIFSKNIEYTDAKEIAKTFIKYLSNELKVNKAVITPPLSVYYTNHNDTFLFVLMEQGFKITNADIDSVVLLVSDDIEQNCFTSRTRNMVRKAEKLNIDIKFNASVEDFWKVMEITFKKHGTNSTHTFEEWKHLSDNLPDYVWCDIAYYNNKPIAGIGHFKINNSVDSSFYLCRDIEHQETQALSLLIYKSILNSQKQGYKWFDFGTSSVNMIGRENIFKFKESFGAIGIFRNTYTIQF